MPWTLDLPHEQMLDRLRGDHERRFPTLSRLAASPHDPAHSAFEFGLARILDGLDLLIDKRTATTRRPRD